MYCHLKTKIFKHFSHISFTALYSKAKGQYLRVALPMHALFLNEPLPESIPQQIPEAAIKAAVSLVNLCISQTSIIAGRDIADGKVVPRSSAATTPQLPQPQTVDEVLQQYVLMQPGNIISATRLTNSTKFRNNGGKPKVVMIFTTLANKELATIQYRKSNVRHYF